MANVPAYMRKLILLSLFFGIGATSASVAGDPRLCAMQARDYANVMAPRTGAPSLKQPPGLPPTNQRDPRPEAMRMAPNQDADRRAYEACMSRS